MSPDSSSSMKANILALVQEIPGLHFREIARRMETSIALVEYHLRQLDDEGRVFVEADASSKRVYCKDCGLDAFDRQLLQVLRNELRAKILLYLLQQAPEPVRHMEITQALGIAKPSVSFHLKNLMERGLVQKTKDRRFELLHEDALRMVLSNHKPAPSQDDTFLAAWSAFYGS